MPVHSNSVIPTRLKDYHPEAYEALTNQENYCYTESNKGGYEEYVPFFSTLASSIDGWFSVNRTESVRDLIEGAYVYLMFGHNFGTELSRVNQLDAYALIDMNGYLDSFVARPVNYYDDYYDPTSEPTYDPLTAPPGSDVITAEHLQEDAAAIIDAAERETSRIKSLSESYRAVANRYSFRMLFDPPQTAGNAIGYEGIADIIFIQKNWKMAFQTFNIDLELPSYI